MLDLSIGLLISGLILGTLGIVLFKRGKQDADWSTLAGGMALGILPIAVHSLLLLWGLSFAVLGGLWAIKRFGGDGMI